MTRVSKAGQMLNYFAEIISYFCKQNKQCLWKLVVSRNYTKNNIIKFYQDDSNNNVLGKESLIPLTINNIALFLVCDEFLVYQNVLKTFEICKYIWKHRVR